jgi:hypothetical protein
MGFKAFQRDQIQKSFKNSHKGGVKNDKLFPKAWKKGEATKQKKRNIKRGYQKPPRHTFILGAHLLVEHPCLKHRTKKEGRGNRAKGDAKDPNAIMGVTKFNKGDEPRR